MSFFIRKSNHRDISLPSKLTDRATPNRKQPGNKSKQGSGGSRGRKRGATGRANIQPPQKQKKQNDSNEEITSESEDEDTKHSDPEEHDPNVPSDNEEETEQEARIRLAKQQINELKNKLIEKHGVANDDDVGDVLREQELIEEGRILKNVITDEYAVKELTVDVVARGKVLKSPLTCLKSTHTAIYASTKSGLIIRLQIQTLTSIKRLLTPPPVTSLALSESTLAASTPTAIHLLSPTDLSTTHTFTSSRNAMSLALSTETLFSTHKDRTVKLWNIQERAYVESLFGHQDIPTCVDVLHSNRIVTTGGFDKTLRVWKIDEESQLVYNWDEDMIDVVKVISGGYFVGGSCSGNLGLFSFGRKKPLSVVDRAHGVDQNSVARWVTCVGGVGDLVVSGSDDGVVKVWRVVARKLVFVRDIRVPDGVVIGIEVLIGDDGFKLVVGLGTEMKNGRWGQRKSTCSKILIVN